MQSGIGWTYLPTTPTIRPMCQPRQLHQPHTFHLQPQATQCDHLVGDELLAELYAEMYGEHGSADETRSLEP